MGNGIGMYASDFEVMLQDTATSTLSMLTALYVCSMTLNWILSVLITHEKIPVTLENVLVYRLAHRKAKAYFLFCVQWGHIIGQFIQVLSSMHWWNLTAELAIFLSILLKIYKIQSQFARSFSWPLTRIHVLGCHLTFEPRMISSIQAAQRTIIFISLRNLMHYHASAEFI